jgi:hypothetical protein
VVCVAWPIGGAPAFVLLFWFGDTLSRGARVPLLIRIITA